MIFSAIVLITRVHFFSWSDVKLENPLANLYGILQIELGTRILLMKTWIPAIPCFESNSVFVPSEDAQEFGKLQLGPT